MGNQCSLCSCYKKDKKELEDHLSEAYVI